MLLLLSLVPPFAYAKGSEQQKGCDDLYSQYIAETQKGIDQSLITKTMKSVSSLKKATATAVAAAVGTYVAKMGAEFAILQTGAANYAAAGLSSSFGAKILGEKFLSSSLVEGGTLMNGTADALAAGPVEAASATVGLYGAAAVAVTGTIDGGFLVNAKSLNDGAKAAQKMLQEVKAAGNTPQATLDLVNFQNEVAKQDIEFSPEPHNGHPGMTLPEFKNVLATLDDEKKFCSDGGNGWIAVDSLTDIKKDLSGLGDHEVRAYEYDNASAGSSVKPDDRQPASSDSPKSVRHSSGSTTY